MQLLLILFFFFKAELSIWVNSEHRNCKVYIDNVEQPLLPTSTPLNRRVEITKKVFTLKLVSGSDSCSTYLNVGSKDVVVIPGCF